MFTVLTTCPLILNSFLKLSNTKATMNKHVIKNIAVRLGLSSVSQVYRSADKRVVTGRKLVID